MPVSLQKRDPLAGSAQTLSSPGFPGLSFPGVGAGLVLLRDEKILLLKRRKAPEAGHWNIPGGKVDHMETAALAAARETEEETGLSIGSVEFLCLSEKIIPEDRQHWISLMYRATAFHGEARMVEPDKFFEIGWFGADQLPAPLSRFAADAIAALQVRGLFGA